MYRLILLIAFVAGAMTAADLTGRWTGTMESNGARIPVYLTMNQRDGHLTGFLATGQDTKQVPLDRAEGEGDNVSFEVRDNANRVVKFRLTAAGNRLTASPWSTGQPQRSSCRGES